MSPLKMGLRRHGSTVSPEDLARRSDALTEALGCGGDRLDPADRARAQAVVDKVAARTAMLGGHTVVALAGATGSGKSSLFNELAGARVARVGARRPTTALPTAAVWGDSPATALLDWLGVGDRHHVESPGEGVDASGGELDLDGLVLLDLPDFDSRQVEHRVEADRVLELVDVFVWVTDPQKYADARLHEDYIHALAGHDAVTIVVLNQADRLTPEAVAACRKDLAWLVAADGVRNPEVIVTSALSGEGLVELEHRVSRTVAGHHAAVQRLGADVTAAATSLRSGVADSEPRVGDRADAGLVDALSRAAGIPVVLSAVERDYRREAWTHAGWPLTRWARAFRPDPLRRLRLRQPKERATGVSAADVRTVLGRSSLPPATPAARAAVALASRELTDRAAQGLPPLWADAAADIVALDGEALTDALDQAVVGTSLRGRTPWWWAVFGLLQWLLVLAAIAGLVWLLVLMALGWLQLPQIEPPRWGPLPYPFLLLGGGLLLGLLLSLLARGLARVGARRRRAMVGRRLRGAVTMVAEEHIVSPVRAVLQDHRRARELLDAARGRS